MNQEKIKHVVALFEACDPSFMDAFNALVDQLTTEEHWQLLRLVTAKTHDSVRLAEEAHGLAQAA